MQQTETRLEVLQGTVQGIRWRSDDTGWTVLSLKASQADLFEGASATVVGILPELYVGERVEFSGCWQQDPKYGRQFKAERCNTAAPTDDDALVAYLGSGLFPGIRETMAQRIVDQFGPDTFDILSRTPDRLAEVRGISTTKATALAAEWQAQQASRDAVMYLAGLGVSSRMAMKVYERYGPETVAKVKENPYRLANDIEGIGFFKADKIARSMGIPADSPFRHEAGLLHVLGEASSEGHVYLPRPDLLRRAADLLKTDAVGALGAAVERLRRAGALVADGEADDALYLPRLHQAETTCARQLARMLAHPASALALEAPPEDPAAPPPTWAHYLKTAQYNPALELTDQQQAGMLAALTHKVSITTGGPGTGKSHSLRLLLDALDQGDRFYLLCAPTGRAAKRMAEATGREAATLHRTLEYKGGRFGRDERTPLDADLVVVDEASMLDVALMAHLLRALQPDTHLLLVGDVDQLPSVGPGDVLNDLIRSGRIPVTRLTHIFRQSAQSQIVPNAHAINAGQMPDLRNQAEDFFFFAIPDPEAAAQEIVAVVSERAPQKFGVDPRRDIQVLSPMYRGPVGVDALNMRLQAVLNPPARDKAEYPTRQRVFRVGDKVLQLKNNYDKGVYNGDVGFVTAIDLAERTLSVNFEGESGVDYNLSDLDQLTLGYCMSVHKSQGSESPVIVMPVVTQHFVLLQRRLLYTGVTRAKKVCVLVGTQQAVSIAVNNNEAARRHTALDRRLAVGEITPPVNNSRDNIPALAGLEVPSPA